MKHPSGGRCDLDTERKSPWSRFVERLKELQAVIAVGTLAGGLFIGGLRWVVQTTVRSVVREELAEVRGKAEHAAELAAAIPKLREDVDTARESQTQMHADIRAKLNAIDDRETALRVTLDENNSATQERIDRVWLSRIK